MKVALIGNYPPHLIPGVKVKGPSHAATSWNTNLSRGLSKLDNIKVHFVSITNAIERDITIESDNQIFHLIKLPQRINLLTCFQLAKLKIHRKLREIKPDIVHARGPEHGYPYYGVTSPFPCVLSVGIILTEYIKTVQKGYPFRYRILSLFEKRALRKAEHIMCTSTYPIEPLNRLTRAKKYVVENCIDELFFRKKACRNSSSLIFVGMIRPEKGLEYLIDALPIVKQRIREINLKIIGTMPKRGNSYLTLIKRKINEHGLDRNVQFLGYQLPQGVANQMAKSNVLILPSIYESFGCVLSEAMAVGVPVIGSNVGGIRDLINDEKNGLVFEPGNHHELAEKILLLLENNELRNKIVLNASPYSFERFHPQKIADKTVRVYENAIAQSKYKA